MIGLHRDLDRVFIFYFKCSSRMAVWAKILQPSCQKYPLDEVNLWFMCWDKSYVKFIGCFVGFVFIFRSSCLDIYMIW